MLVLYMYYTCITIATARVFDASVIATSGVSVSLSVRPSITRWYTESRQMNMRFLHSVSVNSSSQAYTLNKTEVRENGVKRRFPKFSSQYLGNGEKYHLVTINQKAFAYGLSVGTTFDDLK